MLEAIRPFTLRLHGRVRCIAQGQALELEPEDAERLLRKAPNRVRPMTPPQPLPSSSSEKGLKPVFWESMDGTIIGPGQILSVTQDGAEFWISVAYQRYLYWIRDGLLRSQEAFKAQKQWMCTCCQGTDYWTSPYRSHICRVCHPPAFAGLEKESSG
jgi:hypothetical protein